MVILTTQQYAIEGNEEEWQICLFYRYMTEGNDWRTNLAT